MTVVPQKNQKATEEMTEEKLSETKMHDVLLLLENLVAREEYNIRHIIDCLYDVGSNNIIESKVRSRTLKGVSRLIVSLSKPAFKVVAWRWFKKNCPQLIADWLLTKVTFDEAPKPSLDSVIESEAPIPENSLTGESHNQVVVAGNDFTQPIYSVKDDNFVSNVSDINTTHSLRHLELQQQQFQSLRLQVKVLTGVLVGAIAVFGSGFVWLGYNIRMERAQNSTIEKTDTREKPIKALYSTEVDEDGKNKSK